MQFLVDEWRHTWRTIAGGAEYPALAVMIASTLVTLAQYYCASESQVATLTLLGVGGAAASVCYVGGGLIIYASFQTMRRRVAVDKAPAVWSLATSMMLAQAYLMYARANSLLHTGQLLVSIFALALVGSLAYVFGEYPFGVVTGGAICGTVLGGWFIGPLGSPVDMLVIALMTCPVIAMIGACYLLAMIIIIGLLGLLRKIDKMIDFDGL